MQALRSSRLSLVSRVVNAAEAIVLARSGLADVLVLNLGTIPGGNIRLVESIARNHAAPKIVVVSRSDNAQRVVHMMQAGARDTCPRTRPGKTSSGRLNRSTAGVLTFPLTFAPA